MSEYLLAKYRPVADGLLAAHGLSIGSDARDMLAGTIMQSRETSDEKDAASAPTKSLQAAKVHARALLAYATTKPPTRPDSIRTRSAKLRAALLNRLVAVVLALADDDGTSLNLAELADSLERGDPNAQSLSVLLGRLDRVQLGPTDWQRSGRPWGRAKLIVRAGCIAWKYAGQSGSYSWREAEEVIAGPLPRFLRDLIDCCRGKHVLVSCLEVSSTRTHRKPPGRGLRISDKSLQLAIMDCKKAGLI